MGKATADSNGFTLQKLPKPNPFLPLPFSQGLSAGMRGVVSPFQTLGCDVGINLRRGEMRVAQQFLDAPQIGAGVQQMRGVAVPELVRSEMRIQPGHNKIRLKAAGKLQSRKRRGLACVGTKDRLWPQGWLQQL